MDPSQIHRAQQPAGMEPASQPAATDAGNTLKDGALPSALQPADGSRRRSSSGGSSRLAALTGLLPGALQKTTTTQPKFSAEQSEQIANAKREGWTATDKNIMSGIAKPSLLEGIDSTSINPLDLMLYR